VIQQVFPLRPSLDLDGKYAELWLFFPERVDLHSLVCLSVTLTPYTAVFFHYSASNVMKLLRDVKC